MCRRLVVIWFAELVVNVRVESDRQAGADCHLKLAALLKILKCCQ